MFILGRWRWLMAPVGDKGGSGGKTQEEIEAEEAALEERIGKAIDTRLNKAISGHLTRMTPKLAETIGAQVLAGLNKSKDDDEQEPGGDPATPPKGKAADKDNPLAAQLAAMQKQLEAEKKKREASEAKQAEAETRRQRAEEDDAIKSALMASGVKDEARIRAALHLHRGEGRIKRDEAGAVLFVKRTDDGEEAVPLAKGVAEWAKSEEGKVFMPPSNAAGSGGRGGQNGAAGGEKGKYSNAEFGADMVKAILGE